MSPQRKRRLAGEIEALAERAKNTEDNIGAKVRQSQSDLIMTYYGDPNVVLVHLMLQVPALAQDSSLIRESLGLSEQNLEKVLNTLEELKLIEFKNKVPVVLERNFHLPKSSPMTLAHQSLLRTKCAQKLLQTPEKERYSLAVSFSCAQADKDKLQSKFMEFLKEAEAIVKGSKENEAAYQMNFDLFPWWSPGKG